MLCLVPCVIGCMLVCLCYRHNTTNSLYLLLGNKTYLILLFTLVLIQSEPDLSQASDCRPAGNATGCQCQWVTWNLNVNINVF